MPFKLRLKKTRQYNVLSRNVLVISVELLDKTTLECTLSADSTGQDCLHNVCQRLSLHQLEFLGLRYMSKKPYPKVRWVELDRPLKKQLDKYAQSPTLALAVLYYIHDVTLLQDDVTRSHYFLQVKQDVLEGKLRCNHEQAVLLASYSLQAEFGDHQPDRHTAEYLKDFKLFPKQIGSEGEVGALLEAVVWQYSSLQGLAQALAETYYILEAQGLDGYGQETFMARDERGSEVYLGTSLMGIDVRPAAGQTHVFYRWNDITNLVNNKRNFGIECQRTDETVHFTFDEPDAAKYVWKMCVKQHTFYKRNQEVLEGGTGPDTRSLAIPDLQSSVMATTSTTANTTQLHHHSHHLSSSHDMLDSRGGLGEVTLRSTADQQQALATYSTTLPQFDLSYIHQSAESSGGHLGSAVESSGSQLMSDPSYGLLSQSAYSLNTAHHPQQTQVVIATHSQVSQPQQQQQPTQQQQAQQQQQQQQTPSQQQKHQTQQSQLQHEATGQQIALYSSNLSLPSTRGSFRRSMLPLYRPAPDYETALVQKYGPGVNLANIRATMLYSSQPEISNSHVLEGTAHDVARASGGLGSYSHYKGYTDLSQHPDPSVPQLSRSAGILMPGPLHNTYSTPELASPSRGELLEERRDGAQDEVTHMYSKPPPPYPYHKPSSNSTPDLASTTQGGSQSPDLASRRRALLTASLGCLGSPDLSRTYENLADLSEAVESLRHELSRTTGEGGTAFLSSLHPFNTTYHNSCNELDAIYQLSDGRVSIAPVPQAQYPPTSHYPATQFPQQYAGGAGPGAPQEPIYQNIAALRTEDARERARSAPEMDNAALGVSGPTPPTHLLAQLPEEVQGSRGRTVSQPARQPGTDTQLYLGEQQQQQQQPQRGPIEAINATMGQIPMFSAQQELRHNHHHLLHLQQMQALSIQQQQQQQLQQQLQLQQHKEQQLHQQLQLQHKEQQQQQQQQQQHLQQLQAQQQQQQQHVQHQVNQQRQQQQQQIQEQHRQQQDQQRQQQLRQTQTAGAAQQAKQQQQQQESGSGEGSGLKLSPRKKWGAPSGQRLLLAGQTEVVLPRETHAPHDRGKRRPQEAEESSGQARSRGTSLDSILNPESSKPRGREASLDPLDTSTATATSRQAAAGSRGAEGSAGASGGAKGATPDVLRGATPKGPKDPRAVQLEGRLVKGDILQEFEAIPKVKAGASFTTATKADNIPRNRYKDIVPYEENRVKLTPSKDNKSGYINASHITASVGESQRFYICCQGPLANTVAHFWQCVWEADVYLVVMLTSVTGDTATSKSFPYWPQTDNTSVECDQYRVYRKHSTVSRSHITSRLQVVHVPTRKSRNIWHLQYTDWADHGCPEDLLGFISFLEELSTLRRYTYKEVRGVGRNRNTPVLVHCSAGVGRSGVTILCDLLLEATDHNLPLDPPKVLQHLRQQRMALVQTIAQYKLVYQVLLAYLNRARLI